MDETKITESIDIPAKLKKYTTISDDTVVKFGKKKIKVYTKKQAIKNKVIKGVIAGIVILSGITAGLTHQVIDYKIREGIEKIQERIEGPKPESKYETSIPFYENEVIDQEEFEYINLSESSLSALSFLKNHLINDAKRFVSQDIESVSPALLIANYENHQPTSFNLICDINEKEFITFQYMVEDPETFNNLLDSSAIEITDIINEIDSSIMSINLINMPTTNTKITINGATYYSSKILETKQKVDNNEDTYNLESFYSFNLIYSEKGKVFQKTALIKKDDVESNKEFDKDNLNSIYNIYKKQSEEFNHSEKTDLQMNNLSLIFLSAQKQQKENTPEFSN